MPGNHLIITSKNGNELDFLIETAKKISYSGKRVRILLFGDAVFSLTSRNSPTAGVERLEFLACREDVEARGLARKLSDGVRTLGYDEIVEMLMTGDDDVANYV